MSAVNDQERPIDTEISVGSDLAAGVVIVEYASPVTWATMDPLFAVQVARLLDKHAARVLENKGRIGIEFDDLHTRSVTTGTPPPPDEPVSEPGSAPSGKKRSRGKGSRPHDPHPG